MKRKMFFRLAVTCLVAVSALIACTKDYESDIKELQNKVDGLSQQVADLDKLIKDGYVITDVSSITGGTRVTLSNGEHFDVTNGKDGNDGEDGKDGTTWKIGDNGNWWADYGDGKGFVDSGKASKGADGKNGTNGTDGVDGKSAYELAKDAGFTGTEAEWIASLKGEKGDKGRNGDYYYPCVDKESANYKHWIKVDGETGAETPQEALWLSDDVVTAVWDEDSETITFHNVEGADEGIVEINLSTGLNSLAVIPETWDATLGMPSTTVYAMLPSAWEIYNVFGARNDPNYFRTNGVMWVNQHSDRYYSQYAYGAYFWCILWSTYLGKTNQTNSPNYNAQFDISSPSFTYTDICRYLAECINEGHTDNNYYEMTYETFRDAVDQYLKYWTEALNVVDRYNLLYTRQFPVSELKLKYRVNPAGANLKEYQFNMIDRSLKVTTKADGDQRAHAVKKLKVEKAGADQLNATGYIDYFKYWADQPLDWWFSLFLTKELFSWTYAWDGNHGTNSNTADYSHIWTPAELAQGNNTSWGNNIGRLIANVDGTTGEAGRYSASNWMKAMGISYETIVALEASKNGKGAEAIVSDFSAVKMEYVVPMWTAYNHHEPNRPVERWMSAPSIWTNLWKGTVYENDYLVVGDTYDVAAHMRFADPYYGKLENLGFTVRYDYYVFSHETNEAANQRYDSTGLTDYNSMWPDPAWEGQPGGQNPYGGWAIDFGAWDKVECTTDGKVSVKKDAETGKYVKGAVGKYVLITADASIWNEAAGMWYNSSVAGYNRTETVDEFAAQYLLFVIPSEEDSIFIPKDLGEFDYLSLSQTVTVPTSLVYEWEGVDMDFDGFNRVYEMTGSTLPAGVSLNYTPAGGFVITIDNAVALGQVLPADKKFIVTFSPKQAYQDQNFPDICVSFGYNITINWAETEPILNPNYILYEDKARTQLTPTIINPDPATLSLTGNNYVAGAWKNHRTESTDMTKVPYVDSIVSVKGKAVDGVWKPQTSIKEHIKDYGQYLDAQPNIANMSMAIDWNNTRYSDGTLVPNTSAEIFKIAESTPTYQYQQMIMKEAFHPYEEYRDYLVNITVKLANGTEKIVKAYIVRYINPFVLKVTDVELHTHKDDWCAKQSNILICDVDDPSIVIYDFANRTFNQKYVNIYPGLADALAQEANRPKWLLERPVDPSFGTILENGYETEHLRVDTTSAWFYWANGGTNLQENKETTFEVTLNIPNIAELATKGKVTVLSVANSNVFHEACDAQNPTPQPGDHSNPTWEIIFE